MRTLFILIAILAPAGGAFAQERPQPASNTQSGEPDQVIAAAQDGATYVRRMFTRAAEQMTEEDYAFKPTPEVRSFGQLMAHVADSNYGFCSAAKGENAPVSGLEKAMTKKADIQKALSDSFAYCGGAYSDLTAARANSMVQLRGRPRPVLAVLMFWTNHSLLHYGNAITYMRLRGKIPPSSEPTPMK